MLQGKRRSRSSCPCEAQSPELTLLRIPWQAIYACKGGEDRTKQRNICAALHPDRRSARQLDMNRAGRGRCRHHRRRRHVSGACCNKTRSRVAAGASIRWGQYNRQQCTATLFLRSQSALPIGPPPIENLMRVHTLGLRYSRYARARQQGQLYDPPLLDNRSVYPSAPHRHLPVCLIHEPMVLSLTTAGPDANSERLRSGWDGTRRSQDGAPPLT